MKVNKYFLTLFIALLLSNFAPLLWALAANPEQPLLAQLEGDESYDPFTDYSEFEDAAEEEADINFFRNGRFLTLGFSGGSRMFTSVYGEILDPGAQFGLFVTYFFDLRFAMQFAYSASDHALYIPTPTDPATGNVNLTGFSFDLKYFLNTQNVTRGLAALNPYLIGGITSFNKTIAYSTELEYIRDINMGFDFGLGIEIPMLRNKMFFGAQACYHYVTFADENQQAQIKNQVLPIIYQGDTISMNAVLGINF